MIDGVCYFCQEYANRTESCWKFTITNTSMVAISAAIEKTTPQKTSTMSRAAAAQIPAAYPPPFRILLLPQSKCVKWVLKEEEFGESVT